MVMKGMMLQLGKHFDFYFKKTEHEDVLSGSVPANPVSKTQSN